MSSVANSGTAAVAAPQNIAKSSVVCMAIPVRRILTIHLNGLGDLLFTLPALRALRESFPGARICSVVPKGLQGLLQESADVDDILLRPEKRISAQTVLWKKLREQHFDLAVAFSQSRNATLMAFASGAPTRAGFTGARLGRLLTHQVYKVTPPTIETHLELVQSLGCRIPAQDYNGLLAISPQSFQRADALLAAAGVRDTFAVIACAASGKRTIKEWPAEHWQRTIALLAAKIPVVLLGATRSEAILTSLPKQLPVYDFGGQTDLPVLAALCQRARVFAGIDSGVLHLSACMGTPVVGIYGPSDWRLTPPRGVPHRIVRHEMECSPCLLAKCKWEGEKERACLTQLMPAQVLEAIDAVLLESSF